MEHLKGVRNVTVKEKEIPYNPDFVKSVQEGREEYKRGDVLLLLLRIYGSEI